MQGIYNCIRTRIQAILWKTKSNRTGWIPETMIYRKNHILKQQDLRRSSIEG